MSIAPDIRADFTALPIADGSYPLVVFDPPRLARNGASGWTSKKYGTLGPDWRTELAGGFAECFRVLKPGGTLVFKWSENEITLGEILKLSPERPLLGHRSGKNSQTHWVLFQKKETT